MKTLPFFTAIVFSAALFSGCKKSTYNLSPDSSPVAANSAADAKTTTTMQSLLVVSSGYANASSVSIYGNGQTLYHANGPMHIDLFRSLMDQGIYVAPGFYNNLQLAMSTGARDGSTGLYLKGVVRIDDDIFVPVQILINAAADIRAFPKVQYIQPGTTMFGLMNMSANRIGVGISQQMWESARDPLNPMITISATQNPELYTIVLKNLNTMMHIGFSGTEVLTTTPML